MKKIAFTVISALALVTAIVIMRAATWTTRQFNIPAAPPLTLDAQAMVRRLADAIKHKTISFQSAKAASAAEFSRFEDFLTTSFPRVHEQLAKEIINEYSLLFTWRGQDERLKPILLMAHLDVVPVDPTSEVAWTYPPFSGQFADGYIWGRGAIDDKASLMAILEAVEHLLEAGFVPQRTVLLAFGHDEEIGGAQGAAKIAERLASRRMELEFVLDEGMTILSGVINGIDAPVALIGVAEKGYLSIELSAYAPGGHSSMPPDKTAIGSISRALQRIEQNSFAATLRGPTRAMLEHLGPEMSWGRKLALANLWLFEPLVVHQLSRSPLTNTIVRTTVAPTLLSAGVKDNLLPTRAHAVINLRIMPGESTASALEQVRKAIDDPTIRLAPLPIRVEPSAVTDSEGPSFKLLARTIRQTAPQALVAPALLVAATDSRHYAGLTRNILRFLPITLTEADTKRYHGINERISLSDYQRCVSFYAQLIKNADASLRSP